MTFIRRLLSPEPVEPSEPYFLLCSGCLKPCSGDNAHAIPQWNSVREDFLTTYRCGVCWKRALEETRAKIRVLDAEVREKFCRFLDRHGFSDAHIVMEASLTEASRMMEKVLDAIESEKLRLSP